LKLMVWLAASLSTLMVVEAEKDATPLIFALAVKIPEPIKAGA